MHLEKRKQLRAKLDALLESFSGDSIEFVKDRLAEIRSELTQVELGITNHKAVQDQLIEIPSEGEAREILKNFGNVLLDSDLTADGKELDQARSIISMLTGGRIDAYQCGEKKAQKGWLKVNFTVNPSWLLLRGASISGDTTDADTIPIEIEIKKKPTEIDPRIAQARELYDAGKLETEISRRLGVSRSLVYKWIKISFNSEGVEKPNGYERRKQIEAVRELHHYQQISESIFELAASGMKLHELAERHGVHADTVIKAWTYARAQRELPQIDWRNRPTDWRRKPR